MKIWKNRKSGQSHRTTLPIKATRKRVAEAILDDRINRQGRKHHQEYLIKWQGCGDEENTWEWALNLKAFQSLIDAYHRATRMSPKQVGENVTGRLLAMPREPTLLCPSCMSCLPAVLARAAVPSVPG